MLIIVELIFLEENFGDLSKNFNRLMYNTLWISAFQLYYVKIIILQITPKSENLQKICSLLEVIIKTYN